MVIDYFRETDAVDFATGDMIHCEGDAGEVMYAVQAGEVDIFHRGQLIETIGKHGMFGELGLVDHLPHTTTAIARTDCRLVPVDQQKFLFLVHETPTFALQVMSAIGDRVRALLAHVNRDQ